MSTRDWDAIATLLLAHEKLMGHPKLAPLQREIEAELEQMQLAHNPKAPDDEEGDE